MQGGAERVFGRGAFVDAIENSFQIARTGCLDGLHHGERPRISVLGETALQIHPRRLERGKRGILVPVIHAKQHGSRGRVRALAFHPLRNAFVEPRGATAVRFLIYKAVGQLVLQNTRKLRRHANHSLHGHADAAIVERSRPAWRARNVLKELIGVERDGNRLLRDVIERRGDIFEIAF